MSKICSFCQKREIKFMPIRGGRVLPFNNELIPLDAAHGDGWVPVRGYDGVFLRPQAEIPQRRLEQVSWVAIRHTCVEYDIARMRVRAQDWANDEMKRALMTIAPERRRRR